MFPNVLTLPSSWLRGQAGGVDGGSDRQEDEAIAAFAADRLATRWAMGGIEFARSVGFVDIADAIESDRGAEPARRESASYFAGQDSHSGY